MKNQLDKKTLERIVKCVVNYNGQKVQFDKKFLELQDSSELIVFNEGDSFTLITKFKK